MAAQPEYPEILDDSHPDCRIPGTIVNEVFNRFNDHSLSEQDAAMTITMLLARFVVIVVPPERRAELVAQLAEGAMITLRANNELPNLDA